MSRYVVVGSGRLGRAVQHALVHTGADVDVVSRSSGFDVTRPETMTGLDGADAVIEATDIFTSKAEEAIGFFTTSTRNLNAAARSAGVAKHVLVSIVNCQDPRLSGNGYYAGKAEQERAAERDNESMILVRSTLWYEFARQNLDRMRFGPLAIVPKMTAKPVALAAVATVVAECLSGALDGSCHDVSGPDIMTLWEMTRPLPGKGCLPISVPAPGEAGRALRNGVLVPEPACKVVGPGFDSWLADQ